MRVCVSLCMYVCVQASSSPSLPPSPGPNSPLDWVEDYVLSLAPQYAEERSKILLGLNFYGYDFTSYDMDRECVCVCV